MPRIPQQEPKRSEQLALNLLDIGRVPPIILQNLLSGKLEKDRSKIVYTDKNRPDEIGVLLTCDLLQAATICDILREHDRRAGEHLTRVYIKREGSWTKVSGNRTLTIVLAGKVVLNPALFGAVELDLSIRHQPEAVQF